MEIEEEAPYEIIEERSTTYMYGYEFRVKHKSTKKIYSRMVIPSGKLKKDKNELKEILSKAQSLHDSGLQQLVEFEIRDTELSLLYTESPKNSLQNEIERHLHSKERIPQSEILCICWELGYTLRYLKDNGLEYPHLRADEIRGRGLNNLKLKPPIMNLICYPKLVFHKAYSPPELSLPNYKDSGSQGKEDIFALGIIIYYLVTGELPWADTSLALSATEGEGIDDYLFDGDLCLVNGLQLLIQNMLSPIPHKRPDIHLFLNTINGIVGNLWNNPRTNFREFMHLEEEIHKLDNYEFISPKDTKNYKLAINKSTKAKVKAIEIEMRDQAAINWKCNEIEIRKKFRHPSLTQIIDYIPIKRSKEHKKKKMGRFWIISEYIRETIYSQIVNKKEEGITTSFTRGEIYKWLKQISNVLELCHNNNFAYESLSFGGISIDLLGNAKLIDLGTSHNILSDGRATDFLFQSESEYIIELDKLSPPETLNGGKHTSKGDVWALGCIWLTLCTFSPYLDSGYYFLELHNILKGEQYQTLKFTLLEDVGVSKGHIGLMKDMLQYDSRRRPTILQLIRRLNSLGVDNPDIGYKKQIENNLGTRKIMNVPMTTKICCFCNTLFPVHTLIAFYDCEHYCCATCLKQQIRMEVANKKHIAILCQTCKIPINYKDLYLVDNENAVKLSLKQFELNEKQKHCLIFQYLSEQILSQCSRYNFNYQDIIYIVLSALIQERNHQNQIKDQIKLLGSKQKYLQKSVSLNIGTNNVNFNQINLHMKDLERLFPIKIKISEISTLVYNVIKFVQYRLKILYILRIGCLLNLAYNKSLLIK